MAHFTTPVALFIYNRPEKTIQIIDALREIRPPSLYVIADGPRADKPDDVDRCAATRALINQVDWPCEIVTNYADYNLGVGRRVSSGIAWTFQQVGEAIFIEDDCLPAPSFFRYCQELLAKYREDDRVMMICGSNPLEQWRVEDQSYHFSLYSSSTGWASWRRSMQSYDFEMRGWSQPETAARLLEVTGDPAYVDYLLKHCYLKEQGKLDTWAYQWTLNQLLQHKLAVVPSVNLITNIGFGPHATHTRTTLSLTSDLERGALSFPLRSPAEVYADSEYDRRLISWLMGRPDLEFALRKAENHQAAGRHFQALALAEAGLQSGSDDLEATRYRLVLIKVKALAALGHESRSMDAAHDALNDSSFSDQPAPIQEALLQFVSGSCAS